MKTYPLVRRLLAGSVLSVALALPVFSQQVFEGTHAVPPAFAGQTRAPLAPRSAQYEVSEFVTGLTRPWAMAHMPVITATPAPPEEPPAEIARSHGLNVRPCKGLSVSARKENSGVFVRPTITAPALRRFVTTGASPGA